MEDVFGDIIYILLTLAVVLFAAFRKKKVSGQVAPSPEKEAHDPLNEVFPTLKDLFGGERETFPHPYDDEEDKEEEAEASTFAPKMAGNLKGVPFVNEGYVFSARAGADDSRRQRKIPKKMPVVTEPRKGTGDGDYYGTEYFDLRQAVIYSEILKRPDF